METRKVTFSLNLLTLVSIYYKKDIKELKQEAATERASQVASDRHMFNKSAVVEIALEAVTLLKMNRLMYFSKF